ncbi:hypothetical protein YC2023_038402 [Brassica napus]
MPFHEPQQNNVDWCRPKSCIRVTTHHCFFDGTRHRHHRVRFAKIHLYKNYTRHWSIYAIGAGVETQIIFSATFMKLVRGRPSFKYIIEKLSPSVKHYGSLLNLNVVFNAHINN